MVEPNDPAIKTQLFTMVRNSAHKNISSLFNEKSNRQPERDDVTLVKDLLGSYPGAFWHLNERDLPQLAIAVKHVRSEQDYQQLLDKFGVRRTSTDFWSFSDKLNQLNRNNNPVDAGLLDYNRVENR